MAVGGGVSEKESLAYDWRMAVFISPRFTGAKHPVLANASSISNDFSEH